MFRFHLLETPFLNFKAYVRFLVPIHRSHDGHIHRAAPADWLTDLDTGGHIEIGTEAGTA